MGFTILGKMLTDIPVKMGLILSLLVLGYLRLQQWEFATVLSADDISWSEQRYRKLYFRRLLCIY